MGIAARPSMDVCIYYIHAYMHEGRRLGRGEERPGREEQGLLHNYFCGRGRMAVYTDQNDIIIHSNSI